MGVMNIGSEDRVFVVTPIYRYGAPAAALAAASLLFYKFYSDSEVFDFRMAMLMVVVSVCIYFYYGAIRLVVGQNGIHQSWPLQRDLYLSWDSIIRVRRGGEPGRRSFFIDLIASPTESIQFSPQMFENSPELLALLEKHLGAAFRDDGDGSDSKRIHGDVAVTEAETPLHQGASRVMLFTFFIILILLTYLFFST